MNINIYVFIFYLIFYHNLRNFFKKFYSDNVYITNLISLFHSVISVLINGIFIFILNEKVCKKNEFIENNVIIFSLGYFIYDSYYCYVQNSKVFIIHHLLSSLILITSLYFNEFAIAISRSTNSLKNRVAIEASRVIMPFRLLVSMTFGISNVRDSRMMFRTAGLHNKTSTAGTMPPPILGKSVCEMTAFNVFANIDRT